MGFIVFYPCVLWNVAFVFNSVYCEHQYIHCNDFHLFVVPSIFIVQCNCISHIGILSSDKLCCEISIINYFLKMYCQRICLYFIFDSKSIPKLIWTFFTAYVLHMFLGFVRLICYRGFHWLMWNNMAASLNVTCVC